MYIIQPIKTSKTTTPTAIQAINIKLIAAYGLKVTVLAFYSSVAG